MAEVTNLTQNADRRAWARHTCSLNAFCRQLGDNTRLAWPAYVRNVSIGGLCLQSSRPYEPSTFLALEPGDGATVPWPTRLVCVLHARRLGANGDWTLGCAFVSRITDQQLQFCRNPEAPRMTA